MIPWIQVYSNLTTHPKTARLAEELKLSSSFVSPGIVAAGILVGIWTWAIQNAYDGDLSRSNPSVIADACRWKKKPEQLIAALMASGYLDPDMKLHDWTEYAVLLIDAEDNRKEKTRERVKRYREKNADVTLQTRYSNVTVRECNAPTIHNHTIPDLSNVDIYNNNSWCPNVDAPARAHEAVPREKKSEKAAPDAQNVELSRVMTAYQDRVNPQPSTACTAELIEFSRLLGADLCCRAIDTACDENKRSWAYIRGILRGYQRDGVKTLADAQRREQQHEAAKASKHLPIGVAPNLAAPATPWKSDLDKFERIYAKKGRADERGETVSQACCAGPAAGPE